MFSRRHLPLLPVLAALGCGGEKEIVAPSVSVPPTVRLTMPEVRTLVKHVGQPGFIEAYERTSIYPKLMGYIEKWNVDIGDKVKKDQTLATLFVPELLESYQTKKATVKLDQEKIALAEEAVRVANAQVQAADADVVAAKAQLGQYQAQVDRWDTQVKRLNREAESGVVDQQVLLESRNQLQASTASRDAAKALILKAEADLLAKRAAAAQATVAVAVAKADLAVAESDMKRVAAWVGYMTLTAPYDGVIVARNANTFDFVQPSTGDPTADTRSPYLAPGGAMAPIYVVDRTDVVRVFVDVPEDEADFVKVGTKAAVQVRAYRDKPIPGSVTRTSWALNVKSRTLRAEIDLPNDGKLLPGMYAYGDIVVERPGVRAVPAAALAFQGDRQFVWLYADGKATRAEVRTGLNAGDFVEVTARRPAAAGDDAWVQVDGTERVILGDLSVLAEGGAVKLADATSASR